MQKSLFILFLSLFAGNILSCSTLDKQVSKESKKDRALYSRKVKVKNEIIAVFKEIKRLKYSSIINVYSLKNKKMGSVGSSLMVAGVFSDLAILRNFKYLANLEEKQVEHQNKKYRVWQYHIGFLNSKTRNEFNKKFPSFRNQKSPFVLSAQSYIFMIKAMDKTK